jgi:hypothetical protein
MTIHRLVAVAQVKCMTSDAISYSPNHISVVADTHQLCQQFSEGAVGIVSCGLRIV